MNVFRIFMIIQSCLLVGCATQGVKMSCDNSHSLAGFMQNTNFTLSEHVVISDDTIGAIENKYTFAKPTESPRSAENWRVEIRPKLRAGDEMYYIEYNNADHYESFFYFFRDGCTIAVVPWAIS